MQLFNLFVVPNFDKLGYAIIAVLSYLIGSLNGALMASRWILNDDIRKHGSGNAGSTNVLRTYGIKWTVPVAIWDIAKGALAVFIGYYLLEDFGKLLAGLFVILGHVFPLYFKFKGGKGVITACAVLFMFDWRVAAIALGCFFIIVITTRYISLGSIVAVSTLPFLMPLFGRGMDFIIVSAMIAALIIILHRANIQRLINHSESKLSMKRKK